MDLHEFNSRVLNSIGIVDETGRGHLSRVIGSGTSEFTIGGKRVVLPTSEHLRSSGDGTIIYHPLSENITRGESDMIKSLRDTIMYKLTVTAVAVLTELGRVAATPSEHARLGNDASKYLTKLSEMDTRTYEFLQKVLMRIGPEPERRLISISLRKGDKDSKAAGILRSAKFLFPVMDSIAGDAPDLLGVKYPSKKARASIKALFEIVLGDDETRASYDYGSKNMVAPYFHALMMGYYNIATHLNKVVKQHKKLLGNDAAAELTIPLDWYEGMDALADMRRLVPPQEGNEGAIIVSEPAASEEVTEKVASRLAPSNRDRTSRERPAEKESVDLPWDDAPASRQETSRQSQRDKPAGKSLDDFLNGGRREDDRRGTFGRRAEDRGETRSAWGGRDRRDEREFGRGDGRSFDLGLGGRGREERGGFGRDRGFSDRGGFGGNSRRSFGNGTARTAF